MIHKSVCGLSFIPYETRRSGCAVKLKDSLCVEHTDLTHAGTEKMNRIYIKCHLNLMCRTLTENKHSDKDKITAFVFKNANEHQLLS